MICSQNQRCSNSPGNRPNTDQAQNCIIHIMFRRGQWFAGGVAGNEYLRGDIAGSEYLRETSPETKVCGRHRRRQRFAGGIAGDKGLREVSPGASIGGKISPGASIGGEVSPKTINFEAYGNFNRPYLRLCLITSAPGSWGKRHGKRFSSPKPPTLSAGAAQIGGARVILDLGGEGLRRRMCEAFFLRLRITP